jgi:hypothetical protein
MIKTMLMVASLALTLAAGIACFGLFSDGSGPPGVEEFCEGLEGQARIDCENRKKR